MEGWIDDDGNERGYRYRLRDDGTIASDTPLPQDDHSCSALGYFLLDRFGFTDVRVGKRPESYVASGGLPSSERRRQFAGGRR